MKKNIVIKKLFYLWGNNGYNKILNDIEKKIPKVLHVPWLKKIKINKTRDMYIKQWLCTFINKSRNVIVECKLDFYLYKLSKIEKPKRKVV